MLRAGAPVAYHWAGERQIGPTFIRHGSPALQQEFCPRLARADISFALGMSEPDAGSDLAAVRTTATRVEGGLVDQRTQSMDQRRPLRRLPLRAGSHIKNRDDRHGGLSEFVVDTCERGVQVQPIIGMDGAHHFNEVVLDDVFVP